MLNLHPMGDFKLLTVKLPTEMYVDFSAAVAIMMERTMTAYVHSLVAKTIREAQVMVPKTEFERIREKHRLEIEQNAKARRQQSKKGKVQVRTIELSKQQPAAKRRHG